MINRRENCCSRQPRDRTAAPRGQQRLFPLGLFPATALELLLGSAMRCRAGLQPPRGARPLRAPRCLRSGLALIRLQPPFLSDTYPASASALLSLRLFLSSVSFPRLFLSRLSPLFFPILSELPCLLGQPSRPAPRSAAPAPSPPAPSCPIYPV